MGVVKSVVMVCAYQGLEADVDVQRAIQLVRAQRSGMVQTEVRVMFSLMWHMFILLL